MELQRWFVSSVVLALVLGGTAHAAPTVTQDESKFNVATSSLTFVSENFDGFADQTNVASFDAGAFTVSSGNVFSLYSASFCRSGKCLTDIGERVTLTFDTPVNAFGLWLGDGYQFSSVTVDGAHAGWISTPPVGFVFVGVYDLAASFSSVRLDIPFDVFDVDDVRYASNSVPNPATLALLGIGLAGLGVARRRKAQ